MSIQPPALSTCGCRSMYPIHLCIFSPFGQRPPLALPHFPASADESASFEFQEDLADPQEDVSCHASVVAVAVDDELAFQSCPFQLLVLLSSFAFQSCHASFLSAFCPHASLPESCFFSDHASLLVLASFHLSVAGAAPASCQLLLFQSSLAFQDDDEEAEAAPPPAAAGASLEDQPLLASPDDPQAFVAPLARPPPPSLAAAAMAVSPLGSCVTSKRLVPRLLSMFL
mmetsp:Transcript_78239/g.162450  ORF Transcript_78239/g.162450 Transcript_78239/m.162450 type:complete len:228 (+) Transcript_78239:608-1291(+)